MKPSATATPPAPCYAAHPRTALVAGSELLPGRVEAFGKRWGINELYTDYREMIEQVQPDVVSVCTAHAHTRDEIFPAVARYGTAAGGSVRALWGEKPFATSMAAANNSIRALDEDGVVFQGTYPRRWTPRYQFV